MMTRLPTLALLLALAACAPAPLPRANVSQVGTSAQPSSEMPLVVVPVGPPGLEVAGRDDAALPNAASANGKYRGLIKTLTVPEDLERFGEINDFGRWGPGLWDGEMQPAGYWVYLYPTWYVWRSRVEPGSSPPRP